MHNGIFIRQTEALFSYNNRAFRYGDALFETIKASSSKVYFFYDHFERLLNGMQALGMEIPPRFMVDTLGIKDDIMKLLIKNKQFKSAKVRFSVYRNDGGLYLPDSDEISYVITSEPLQWEEFRLNDTGLKIDIFTEIEKHPNKLANFKTSNALLFIVAARYAKAAMLNDVLILNTKGFVTEAINSNVFIAIGSKIYTPPLTDGCVAGVMRKQVIALLGYMGYEVIDNKSVDVSVLNIADEVFLTNAISGVKWVAAFRNKRYFHRISERLIVNLNAHLKETI